MVRVPVFPPFSLDGVGEGRGWCGGVWFAADPGVAAFAEPVWFVAEMREAWVDDVAVG